MSWAKETKENFGRGCTGAKGIPQTEDGICKVQGLRNDQMCETNRRFRVAAAGGVRRASEGMQGCYCEFRVCASSLGLAQTVYQ